MKMYQNYVNELESILSPSLTAQISPSIVSKCKAKYKKIISNKETNRPRGTLDFDQSGKGRSNPRQYGTKKQPPTICRKLQLSLQYEVGEQTVKAGKIASKMVSSLASWIADKYFKQARSFPRNKTKILKSRLPKLFEVKQLKENLIREFCRKENFTEESIEIKWKLERLS